MVKAHATTVLAVRHQGKVVMASDFKQRCLSLLDQVARTRVRLIVTKRGKPVALVVPVPEGVEGTPTMGSVTLLADDDDDYLGAGERWESDTESTGP